MTRAQLRELIFTTVSDTALRFVAYDRKEDEELTIEVFHEALEKGTVTLDEITVEFGKAMRQHLRRPLGSGGE